ncbi:periplasmic chaperone for outer membrane proteins Skp [Aestuariispira insulae]|uniref:Periplasmic chaperone for outer membrane proteins Skp n=2 Tax=Aestuariispira insulae TaxID=1461337 RepID=A0A3D9HUV6_9PROT|nr:periplasmic chaperone for outer membrane proteins Skp [Aestuariispira insulae]
MKVTKFFTKGLVVALAILAFGNVVQAQDTDIPPAVIGVVDFNWVLNNSDAWKKSLAIQAEDARKQIQDEARAKEQELNEKGKALAGQQAILDSEVFAQKEAEFKKEAGEAQQYFNLRKAKLDSAFQKAKNEIETVIARSVAEVAQENKLNMILKIGNQGTVFLYEPQMNVSEAVLQKTNAALDSVILTVE